MTAESVAESNQSLAEKASNFEEANNIPKLQSGELTTSGDELVPKVRKPYTITKQRERWTEEEHQKFLEALKLYGRAWRRIEEHIGTKTTVQIRSHAQKFFSKLEREQAGGMLSGKAQDIGIPPPRPKRKPSHPYPRKAAMEDNVSSQTVLSSAPVSPTICEGAMKPAAFGPYVSPRPRNVQLEIATMGKSLGGSQAELKLFGQTVVVPTATRAVPVGKGIGKQAVVDPEGFDLLEQSQRNVEAEQAPFAIASACSSEITMLESKNDSLNRQRGDATEVRDCATNTELKRAAYHENPGPLMHQFGNELRKLFATATLNMPMTGQHSPMDLALYYSRFMEGLQGANTTTPFCNLGLDGAWQPGSSNACIYAAAMAALWPNLSGASLSEMTSSVLRSMLTGVSSDTYKAENQIDALAAASAWWTLQGFIRRGFLAQHMGSVLETAASLGVNLQLTMKRQDSSLQNDKRQDGQEGENMTMNVCDTVEGDDTLALLKDSTHGTSKRTLISNFEGLDGGKRRVRSRSVSGYNDPCEKNGPDSRPPSSSGSGDASGSCETMHQPNADDASGNSGPSSNSSRCGIPQVTGKGFIPTDGSSFDKDSTAEATTEKELNAVKTPSLQHASSCSNKARPQHPRGQKVARPSRSGGSDGEQRKEVSQEGRMAFQALFAHEKLPQTFFRGRNREFTDEDCTTRAPHPSDESVTSDLESVCQFQTPLVSGRSSSFSIPVKGSLDKYTEQISRVESMASGTGPITGECSNWEDGGKVLEKVGSDASAFSVSSSSLSRSGFVPYCRAEVRANPTRSKEFKRSCGLEADDQFRDGNRCLEEEVKQS